MMRIKLFKILIALSAILIVTQTAALPLGILKKPIKAPEFTHQRAVDWLNTQPIRMKDLAGKVVLLDFWTFSCWNCYRSFPWLRSIETRYRAAGLQVVGVHSPEFDHERKLSNVRAKMTQYKLRHPVMIDNDFSYWQALGNRYWPTFYVIDKRGYVRAVFAGETHKGDKRAQAIERFIEILLAEKE